MIQLALALGSAFVQAQSYNQAAKAAKQEGALAARRIGEKHIYRSTHIWAGHHIPRRSGWQHTVSPAQ